jgi:hypothetical protein
MRHQPRRKKHSGWEIRVWQDPLDPSSHRLGKYWPHVSSGAQLADLILLDVIFEYGGIYLDSDVHVCRSLADIADIKRKPSDVAGQRIWRKECPPKLCFLTFAVIFQDLDSLLTSRSFYLRLSAVVRYNSA